MNEIKHQHDPSPPKTRTIIVKQKVNQSNGSGTAGFVLSIFGLLLGWIPIIGWFLWFLGVIFSFIGIFKQPRGLAIAGLIISFIGIILIALLAGLFAIGASAN